MPPARPRVVADDSRSEASSTITSLKERATIGTGISKVKKSILGSSRDHVPPSKIAVLKDAWETVLTTSTGTAQVATGAPQTDWNSLPIATLHTYRAAHKMQTPSSFSHPHADLLYNASEVGRRAPSQVLARRKSHDLRVYRRKLAQVNGHTNGIHKSISTRLKQKEEKDETSSQTSRTGRKKKILGAENNRNGWPVAESIEPISPTMVSQSAASSSDQAASTLLNASDPESTIIGRQSPTSLATTIRKHFNAQQLNEAETIARFTYVTRQQGYGSGAVTKPITGAVQSGSNGLTVAPNLRSITLPVKVEGSAGDGDGWIMGSMGRQVRISDTSSEAAFRLRFRP